MTDADDVHKGSRAEEPLASRWRHRRHLRDRRALLREGARRRRGARGQGPRRRRHATPGRPITRDSTITSISGSAPMLGDLADLASSADIVVAGIDCRRGGAAWPDHPALVVVTVTPVRHRWAVAGPCPHTEFTLQAAVGSTGQRGLPDDVPLAAGGRLGEWITGTYAAVGALAALRRRRVPASGRTSTSRCSTRWPPRWSPTRRCSPTSPVGRRSAGQPGSSRPRRSSRRATATSSSPPTARGPVQRLPRHDRPRRSCSTTSRCECTPTASPDADEFEGDRPAVDHRPHQRRGARGAPRRSGSRRVRS